MFKNILFSMMFLVSSLLANTLGLEDNGDGTWNVSYSSEDIIAGFQFDVDDATVNSASGGDATANGFMISASSTTVLGFSLSGGTIPAGNGTLLVLDLSGTPASLSGIVVSDPSGNALDFSYDSGDPEPTLPTVSILSPTDGSSIEGSTINVEVAGTDMGDGDHYHAYLDGAMQGMFYSDTFSIDVDRASYSNIRRMINNSQPIPVDAVKVEEMINYFSYNYPEPKTNDPFSVYTELVQSPWNTNTSILRIGLKGKTINLDKRPASNLVFLLDVSGSMNSSNKLPLLKSTLKILVDELNANDKVSLVVYAGAAGLVLPPTSGANKETILNAIDNLSAGGSTAGGQGIKLAYKVAEENFIKGLAELVLQEQTRDNFVSSIMCSNKYVKCPCLEIRV